MNTFYPPVPVSNKPVSLNGDGAHLHFQPKLFTLDSVQTGMPTGISVLAGVKMCFRQMGYAQRSLRNCTICVDGEPLPREEWNIRLIDRGMHISVNPKVRGGGGGGGKNPLNTILSVVVVVAAALATWYVGGAGGWAVAAGYSASTAAMMGSMAGMAVMTIGMLAVNMIAPMTSPKLKLSDSTTGAAAAEKIWAIEGMQNKFEPYGVIPLILGTTRYAPNMVALPYTYLSGNNINARFLYAVAGHNKVSSLRIGSTDINLYRNVKYKIYENWTGQAFTYFLDRPYEDPLSVSLLSGQRNVRTTSLNAREAQLVFSLPQGLGFIDDKGNLQKQTVEIKIEYSVAGRNQWVPVTTQQTIAGGSTEFTTPEPPLKDFGSGSLLTLTGEKTIYSDSNGINTSSGLKLATATHTVVWEKVQEYDNEHGTTSTHIARKSVAVKFAVVSGYSSLSFNGYGWNNGIKITVSGGTIQSGSILYTAETLTPLRRGFVVALPRPGRYDISCTRITQDPDPNLTTSRIFNATEWIAIRSIESGSPIIYNGRPLTVIEIDIQSSDQLTGRLDQFNAIFQSVCPVWNKSTKKWTTGASNNPASVALMCATTRAVGKPDALSSKVHLPAWQEFSEWCDSMGWKYNSVLLSQKEAREPIAEILAAGRASIDYKHAKLSVATDAPDKKVVYPYGPRNSWGFSIVIDYVAEQPHGLMYQFINEAMDYQTDQRIVYADGYNASNATNLIEAEQDGVTSSDLIYKHGRLRLADSKLRGRVYQFFTDFSYLNVSRGNVISYTSLVAMWGYEQARVVSLYIGGGIDEWGDGVPSDKVTHIGIDADVPMVKTKNYALVWFNPVTKKQVVLPVLAQDRTTNVLELQMPTPLGSVPPENSLVDFGIAGKTTRELQIVTVIPQENEVARIICQDYAPQVYNSLTGAIPQFDSGVTIPDRWNKGKPVPPVITSTVSDESVLVRGNGNRLIPRIRVVFTQPATEGVEVSGLAAQYRLEGSSMWFDLGHSLQLNDSAFYIEDVLERQTYEIRMYSTSTVGLQSDFSQAVRVYVVGRTTPPPAPLELFLQGSRLLWTMPDNVPVDVVGWEVWYSMSSTATFAQAIRLSLPLALVQEFDLAAWAGSMRQIWVRTVDDIGLTSATVSMKLAIGDVIVNNVVSELRESERNWPGTAQNGYIDPSIGVIGADSMPMWGAQPMWGNSAMWVTSYKPLVYTTYLRIDQSVHESFFKMDLSSYSGEIVSVEYTTTTTTFPMWGTQPMWGNQNWMGRVFADSAWKPMPDEIQVFEGEMIFFRITMSDQKLAIIEDVIWIFDVEDHIVRLSDLTVTPSGLRLPVRPYEFRWIANLSFGLKSGEAVTVVWDGEQKGIIQNGFVVEGPLVYCLNASGQRVNGIIDATIQGAKGL